MLEISNILFTRWNELNLCYCHWKSNEHLLPGLNGDTDLDVLLSGSDKSKGEEILKNLDFLQCKSQFGSRYPGVDDWIGFDKMTGKFIHLHLHYHIVTGHKGLKDQETGVYIADPNVEIVTLYTRIALKISLNDIHNKRFGKYNLDKSFLVEIKYLKERINWEVVEKMVSKYYGSYATKVISIMKKDSLSVEDVFMLRKIAENTFRKVSRHQYTNRILEFYYMYALKFRKYLRLKLNKFIVIRKVPKSEKGLQVAFLGQDGAGKTTVTTIIRKWWSWKMDVQYIYLGSGDNYHSWRKNLLKKLPNSSFLKLIRAWILLSKYKHLAKDVLSVVKNGERFANKGGMVIFDRYPQVQFPGISDGPKIRSLFSEKAPDILKKLFEKIAIKEEKYLRMASEHHPDLVFKLIISPEESVRRKPENKLEVIKQKHEIIKSLQFDGSDVYVIDATMPLEEEILMIKQIIWDHIQK